MLKSMWADAVETPTSCPPAAGGAIHVQVWATLKALDAKDRLQRAPFASAADAIVASKARAKYSPKLRQQAARMHTPLLLIKSSSAAALHR
jgi:hypothetical protein